MASTYASLKIDITTLLIVGDVISFESSLSPDVSEVAVGTRTTSGQFELNPNVIFWHAQNLYDALIADFGTSYNISFDNISAVTITATDYSDSFSNIQTPTGVTATYTPNEVPVPVFEITGITTQAADSTRTVNARFNIAVANGAAPYVITTPLNKPDPIASPYLDEVDLYFDYNRIPATSATVTIISDYGGVDEATATYPLPTVDKLEFEEVVVVESISGATISCNIIITSGDIPISVEYSLDNLTWQESNTFTGILAGTKTAYVKDDYGGNHTQPFTVQGVEPDKPEPYIEIAEMNPLRFIKTLEYDCTTIRNWDNSLFKDLLALQPNIDNACYNQLITDCDSIVTQILTTYENIGISIQDSEGNEVLSPSAILKTENIDKSDKRDASLFQADDGYTLLAFSGGDIYDPVTSAVTGDYSNPAKKLPQFAELGDQFEITGTTNFNGTFEPREIYKDVSSGYWTVKLNKTFTGTDELINCQCLTVYNELPYNVYEFNTVGTALTNGVYTTIITLTDADPRYEDVEYIGEPLEKVDITNTVAFDYTHSENAANMDFTTGALFRIRLLGRFFAGSANEEDESFQSDDGVKVLQKSVVTESFMFESHTMPYYMVRKMAVISGFSGLLVNGISYTKGEDVDTNDFIDQMNPFYTLKRAYQKPTTVALTEEIGITIDETVIGETTTIAIGI